MKSKLFILLMSSGLISLYAAVPTNINDYSTKGIKKTGGSESARILRIQCTYIAYKANSCPDPNLCVVGLYNPSNMNKRVSGTSHNSNYFKNSTHWLYSHYVQKEGYYFFDLQSVQQGIWWLEIVQTNAGDWYYYDKNISTITVNSSNTTYGTTYGTGAYIKGTSVFITATPNECYRFIQWSDGNTDNPRTITIAGNATYTAEFEQIQYTIEAQSADTGQGSATVTNP